MKERRESGKAGGLKYGSAEARFLKPVPETIFPKWTDGDGVMGMI
jgi:hypothetical protein